MEVQLPFCILNLDKKDYALKYFDSYLNQIPICKTTFGWHEVLPNRLIKLNFSYQKLLFSLLLDKYTLYVLRNELNRSDFMLFNYLKCSRAVPVSLLKKVLLLLDIPFDSINSEIIWLSGINNPKLPFRLSNRFGAEIRMAFLSDGHNPKDPSKNVKYQAGELESHKRIIRFMKLIFGEFSVRTYIEGVNKHQSYFPCIVGDILEMSGVPRGNKTRVNPYIPKDVFTDPLLLKFALQRSFTDEGSCSVKYNSIRIERNVDVTNFFDGDIKIKNIKCFCLGEYRNYFDKYFNNLILGEYLALLSMGIGCSLKPSKINNNNDRTITLTWRIDITGIGNLRKFYANIGFLLNSKNERLDEIFIKYRKYDRFEDSLSALDKLSKNKELFTHQEFASILNVNPNRGIFHLRRLINKNKVKRESHNKYCKM